MAKARRKPVTGDGFHEGAAPSFDRFPGLLPDDFADKVKRYRDIVDTEKSLKAEKEDIAAELDAFVQLTEETALRVGTLVVQRVVSRTASSIKYEKLVERGVSTDDIDAATVPGREYSYIQVKVSEEPQS